MCTCWSSTATPPDPERIASGPRVHPAAPPLLRRQTRSVFCTSSGPVCASSALLRVGYADLPKVSQTLIAGDVLLVFRLLPE